VEIGAELAAAGRRSLAGFPDVEVIEAAFVKTRSGGLPQLDPIALRIGDGCGSSEVMAGTAF